MAPVPKLAAGGFAGLAVAILGVIAFIFAFGNMLSEEVFGYGILAVFFFLSAIGPISAALSKSVHDALRPLLLVSVALSFSFPLSAISGFGARAITGAESGAGTIGTALGGSLATVFLGFVGFCLGVMLLLIVLGGGRPEPDRQARPRTE